jgi:hypothetical protein
MRPSSREPLAEQSRLWLSFGSIVMPILNTGWSTAAAARTTRTSTDSAPEKPMGGTREFS